MTSSPAKKLLVIGGTSQIGDFLLPELVARGFDIYGFTRKGEHGLNPGVTWFTKDIFEEDYPEVEFDTIIHLAYLPHLPVLLSHYNETTRISRVIGFGSTSRFTKAQSADPKEQQTAAHLEQAEKQIAAWCDSHGAAWTIFRPTLIYGRGRDKNVTTIRRFIRRFRFFPLVAGGGGLRQPVHAKDLAAAVMQSLNEPATYGKCYNLSGGETLSYRAMVARIFQSMGKRTRIISIPLPLLRCALSIVRRFKSYRHLRLEMATRMLQDLVFSNEEATRDFGYKPVTFRPDALRGRP